MFKKLGFPAAAVRERRSVFEPILVFAVGVIHRQSGVFVRNFKKNE